MHTNRKEPHRRKPNIRTFRKWADSDRLKHYQNQGVCYCPLCREPFPPPCDKPDCDCLYCFNQDKKLLES